MSKRNMQEQIDRLTMACSCADMTVDELLRKPLTFIVHFAQTTGIALEDVRDLCHLLIQRLNELDAECATFQLLTFLDPTLTSSSTARVRAPVN